MKKTIVLLLVFALGLMTLLAGCGSGGSGEEESEAPALKVGYILPGGTEDGGLSQAMYAGSVEAEAVLEGQVGSVYLENIDCQDPEAVKNAAEELMRQDCTVIAECGWGASEAIQEMAENHSDVVFLDFDGAAGSTPNLVAWSGSMEQARYMAGIAAGSMVKRGSIGYIAPAPSTKVLVELNAFALGVQSVNPKLQVNVIYTGETYNAEAQKAAADRLIEEGAKVLACHAESGQIQNAAVENGDVYVVGSLYPVNTCGDLFLTAPYWYTAAFFIPTFEAVLNGQPLETTYKGSVATGLVTVGETGPAVSDDTRAKIEDTRARMEADVFDIFTGKIEYANGDLMLDEGQILQGDEVLAIDREIKGINVISD